MSIGSDPFATLDVNDYNGNFKQSERKSHGNEWEIVGPPVILGYNHKAPGDSGGATTRIINARRERRGSLGDVDAWIEANEKNRAWNACAIVKGLKYVYFKKFLKGVVKVKCEVSKEEC